MWSLMLTPCELQAVCVCVYVRECVCVRRGEQRPGGAIGYDQWSIPAAGQFRTMPLMCLVVAGRCTMVWTG